MIDALTPSCKHLRHHACTYTSMHWHQHALTPSYTYAIMQTPTPSCTCLQHHAVTHNLMKLCHQTCTYTHVHLYHHMFTPSRMQLHVLHLHHSTHTPRITPSCMHLHHQTRTYTTMHAHTQMYNFAIPYALTSSCMLLYYHICTQPLTPSHTYIIIHALTPSCTYTIRWHNCIYTKVMWYAHWFHVSRETTHSFTQKHHFNQNDLESENKWVLWAHNSFCTNVYSFSTFTSSKMHLHHPACT